MIVEQGSTERTGGVTTLMHVGDEPPKQNLSWVWALGIGVVVLMFLSKPGKRSA